MTTSQTVTNWLSVNINGSKETGYLHYLLKENYELRSHILEQLTSYIEAAHAEARQLWLNATASLDPLEEDSSHDFSGYPSLLPMQTLKGYFGEVFAALVAENFDPFGENNWVVPAHLFRWHNAAFEYLESLRQGGKKREAVLGRTGDDCLAFQMDGAGKITKVLYCEAKCTNSHDTTMIKEAHEKVGESEIVSLPHLIELLSLRNDDDAKRWVDALRQLRLQKRPNIERYDLVSYVCGKHPVKTESWISTHKPHHAYQGGRGLQVAEIHLTQVDELVRAVYGKVDDESDNSNN